MTHFRFNDTIAFWSVAITTAAVVCVGSHVADLPSINNCGGFFSHAHWHLCGLRGGVANACDPVLATLNPAQRKKLIAHLTPTGYQFDAALQNRKPDSDDTAFFEL